MLQRRRNRKRQRSSRLKVAEEEVGEVPGGTFDARPRAVVARRLRALPPLPSAHNGMFVSSHPVLTSPVDGSRRAHQEMKDERK